MTTENVSVRAMALVDGELPPSEAPALIQELARNADRMADLQVYLAMRRGRLAQPYEAMSQGPVPAWLVDTVMRTPMETTQSAAIKPFAHVRELLGRLRGKYPVPAWSIAAGPVAAGVLVALSAWLLLPTSSSGGLNAMNLNNALDRTASGETAPLVTLRPVISFLSKDQAWCRQYDMRQGTTQASAALACRGANGNWQVVLEVPLSVSFAPADPSASSPRHVMADRVQEMMSGVPFDREQEAAQIKAAREPVR